MYTTITGQWNTKVLSKARGKAKHQEAKNTLTASYLASPPAGKIPQTIIVLMENAKT